MSTTPLSTPPSSRRNSVSSSESLVKSSADDKNDREEKSTSAPVMKSKNKKSSLREAFSSSKLSTSVTTTKDPRAEFNKKIEVARQSFVENNESWKKFIQKNISSDGYFYLHKTTGKELHELLYCLRSSPNPKITSMCSMSAMIDSTTATALIKALLSNPTIVTLEISFAQFDAAGLKIFTDSVISNPSSNITSLILRFNNMNDDLVKVLAKAIITNPNSKLTALELEENRIGDEGAKALAEAIETNPSNITELKLSFRFNSLESTKLLLKAIKLNSTITLYKVVTPYISDKYDKMIQDHCKLNAKRLLTDSNTINEKTNSTPDSNKVVSKEHFVIDSKEKPSKEKNNKKS